MLRTQIALILAVSLTIQLTKAAAQEAPKSKPAATPAEAIDFARARELARKRAAGEALSPADEAFVKRAMEAYQAWQILERLTRGDEVTPDRPPLAPVMTGKESVGLKPLSDMKANDRYQGEDGGLYGGGANTPPAKHQALAAAESKKIQPLNAAGEPAADGLIGLISISMSNATQEFSMFKQLADADPRKSSRVKIVDCAQGGQAMAEWASPDAHPWVTAGNLLTNAKLSPQQVQVAWIKLANKGPRGNLQEHGKKLEEDTLHVIQNAKAKFPNLRIAYLSSRIYAGYATTGLNPEPYAYESAFVVRWLIQDQIKGSNQLSTGDAAAKAPVLLWGPYLWADGMNPRATDQLIYRREDLANDGTHPSQEGRRKVAGQLLDFFTTDELAKAWFCK